MRAILRNRPYGAWEWKIAHTEHGMEIVRAIHELPIRERDEKIIRAIRELPIQNRGK